MGRIFPEAARQFVGRPKTLAVAKALSRSFDITYAASWSRGSDEIIFMYAKANKSLADALGLEREIVVVHNPRRPFQPRTIEALDAIVAANRTRVDPIGSIVVSGDPNVRAVLGSITAGDRERAPIVALSESELEEVTDQAQLKAQLASQLFQRDLFALESPLTREELFFGRQPILAELLDRFRQGQNTGLFGLRRMGKTSVLFALGRRCMNEAIGGFAYLDLSDPGLHEGSSRELLQSIVRGVVEQMPEEMRPGSIRAMRQTYSGETAAYHFRQDMARCMKASPGGRLLLALDEIENISFEVSSVEHWSDEFLPFWKGLRALHQASNGAFCYIIAGVNPHILETDLIGRHDNPLFSTMHEYYLEPFDRGTTTEMVRQLARTMGIRVEPEVYDQLFRVYGGHPFLTRQACSYLVKSISARPGVLNMAHLEKHQAALDRRLDRNVKQILTVLATWYPEEYEALRDLALGHAARFRERVENAAPSVLAHLEGYGLVRVDEQVASIPIGLVSNHLQRQPAAQELLQTMPKTPEETIAEISRRRNALEPALRRLLRVALVVGLGQEKACAHALGCWQQKRRDELAPFSYMDMWDELFWDELTAVIRNEWPLVEHIFASRKDDALMWMDHINRFRTDAHARTISEEDFQLLRVCFRRLEEIVENVR